MNGIELKKYNVCNLLLAIVARYGSTTVVQKKAFAVFLSIRAAESGISLPAEEDNISKYLTQAHEVKKLTENYRKWFNKELTLDIADLSIDIQIPLDLVETISKYRSSFNLAALLTTRLKDSNFYPIYINKIWKEKSIANLDLNAVDTNTSLPNFLLYQAYSAANLWDEVTKTEVYELPKYCREGLKALFGDDIWINFCKKATVFFELGTGAPNKTALILEQLGKTKLSHSFIWVDASTPMLEHNVSKVDRAIYPSIKFSAIATNFEDIRVLREFVDSHISTHDPNKTQSCFFILGFTLSNLNEVSFLQKYAGSGGCKKGDVLIFPMEFIPQIYEDEIAFSGISKSGYCAELIKAYNSPEGQKLVLAGLNQINDLKVPAKATARPIRSISSEPSENCIGRAVEIQYIAELHHKNRYGGTDMKELEVIKTTRYFENDFFSFLNKHGYLVKKYFKTSEHTKTLFVEFVGRDSPQLSKKENSE